MSLCFQVVEDQFLCITKLNLIIQDLAGIGRTCSNIRTTCQRQEFQNVKGNVSIVMSGKIFGKF